MFDIFKELMSFLIQKKKFWIIPLVIVLVLVGAILVASQGSILSPFIYTIF